MNLNYFWVFKNSPNVFVFSIFQSLIGFLYAKLIISIFVTFVEKNRYMFQKHCSEFQGRFAIVFNYSAFFSSLRSTECGFSTNSSECLQGFTGYTKLRKFRAAF